MISVSFVCTGSEYDPLSQGDEMSILVANTEVGRSVFNYLQGENRPDVVLRLRREGGC